MSSKKTEYLEWNDFHGTILTWAFTLRMKALWKKFWGITETKKFLTDLFISQVDESQGSLRSWAAMPWYFPGLLITRSILKKKICIFVEKINRPLAYPSKQKHKKWLSSRETLNSNLKVRDIRTSAPICTLLNLIY